MDKVNKLAALVNKPASSPPLSGAGIEDDPERDEKLDADMSQVLTLITKLAGEDLFDMQFLIEAVAQEVREEIRDRFSDGEEEGDDDE